MTIRPQKPWIAASSSARRELMDLPFPEVVSTVCRSQADVAAELGVVHGTLRNWMSSKGRLSEFALARICDATVRCADRCHVVSDALRIHLALQPEEPWQYRGAHRYRMWFMSVAHADPLKWALRSICMQRRELARILDANYSTFRNWAAGRTPAPDDVLFHLYRFLEAREPYLREVERWAQIPLAPVLLPTEFRLGTTRMWEDVSAPVGHIQ